MIVIVAVSGEADQLTSSTGSEPTVGSLHVSVLDIDTHMTLAMAKNRAPKFVTSGFFFFFSGYMSRIFLIWFLQPYV